MNLNAFMQSLLPPGSSRIEQRYVGIAVLLLIASTALWLAYDAPYFLIIPFVGIAVFFSIDSLHSFFFLIVLLVPFSIETVIPGTGSALQIPTEPLIIFFLTAWLLPRILFAGEKNGSHSDGQKITFALLAFSGSLLLSVFTSTIPLISVKLFLNMNWYIAVFYFYLIWNGSSIEKIVPLLYVMFISTSVVVIYTVFNHAMIGFNDKLVNDTMDPFFTEHGSYSANLSIILGISTGLAFGAGKFRRLRKIAIVVTVLLFTGIFLSYTRAAWLGVAVMLFFFFMMKSKELLKFRTFVIIALISTVLVVAGFQIGIQSIVEKKATSITDVDRDLSNLERFNRWVAAIDIIQSHPILGVGLGTYPIMYEKYKDKRFLTAVSNFYGGPHNDYLQYFSEAGIFGILSWLFFVFTLYRVGLKHYYQIRDEFLRNLLLGCLGGVLTYLVHSFFNDFLAYDKVAVPFWIAIGLVVVTIDIIYLHDGAARSVVQLTKNQ